MAGTGPMRGVLPATRPRGLLVTLAAVLAAVAVGGAAGVWPRETLLVVLGVLGAVTLLVHLEWAVLAVVAGSVLTDYVALVDERVPLLLTAVLLGAWVVRRSRRGPVRATAGPVLLAGLVFLVVLAVATSAHPNGFFGREVLVTYAGHLVVLAVLVDTLGEQVAPRTAATVLVGASGLAAVCGLLTWALDDTRRIVAGPLADPDLLAASLVCAVPLALALRAGARRPWSFDATTAVLLLAIAGTQSRGALVGLAVMLAFSVVARLISARNAAVVLVLVATATAFVVSAFPHVVDRSLAGRERDAAASVSVRLDVWDAAVAMTAEHPLLGHGPGAFTIYHQDYLAGGPAVRAAVLDDAHSAYLQTSAELGLLGLAALLAVLATGARASWRRWLRDHDRLAAGVCAALVGSAVTGAFATTQLSATWWLLPALAGALGQTHPRGAIPVPLTRLQESRRSSVDELADGGRVDGFVVAGGGQEAERRRHGRAGGPDATG